MKLERAKNAKRNIIWGIISKIVLVIFPFVIRSYMIQKIGAEYLGLDSLFASILQVLNLAELGFSSAVVYSMYKPIAEDDHKTICALLKYYRGIYRKIGIAIAIIGIILVPFIPNLITGNVPNTINIYYAYLLYLFNSVISYWLYAYKNSLLEAYQRNDVVSKIGMMLGIFTSIGRLLAIIIWEDFYIYIGVLTLGTVANNLLVACHTKELFPELNCEGELDSEIKKDISVKLKGLIISKVCGITRNSFDSICVSMYLGLVATAMYTNYYSIMVGVTSLSLIVYGALVGGVGNSVVLESVEKNYKDLLRLDFAYMWLASWLTACLVCLYQPFNALVFGDDLVLPVESMVLFCVYFYVLKSGDVRSIYAQTKGLWWELRWRAIIESIANIILNFTLGYYFGISGIVLATILSMTFISFCWGASIIFRNVFPGISPVEYFMNHIKYLIVTVIVCYVSYNICEILEINEVLDIIVRIVICMILPNVILFIIYRNTSVYKLAAPWIVSKFLN